MRLVYLTRQYPELSETFVTEELRELGVLGHELTVFAPYPGNGGLDGAPAARYLSDFTRGERLRALARMTARSPLRLARALARPGVRMDVPAAEMAALAPLALAAARADHLHAHFATAPTTLAAQLSALSGTPFSFTAHAYDLYYQPDRLEEKLRRCTLAVTVCEYNRRHIAATHPDLVDKVHVVRCGVDLDRFRRTRPYDPSGPIIAVGRLVPKKGFTDLVRAAAAARGAIPEVVIAGDGPQRGEIEALISRLDAPVRLLGATPHRAVQELFERASAAALPCVVMPDGERDAMPVSIKEAMAMALPFVGTDEVGVPEEVTPERGVLVPPGDHAALAEALRQLYARPASERRMMGLAGRAYAERELNLRTQTQRLVELFRART